MLKKMIAALITLALLLGTGALFAVTASAADRIPSSSNWRYLSDEELYACLSGDITLDEPYTGASQYNDMLLRFIAPAAGWYCFENTVDNPEEHLEFDLLSRSGSIIKPPSLYASRPTENYTVWLEADAVCLITCNVWTNDGSYVRVGTEFTVTINPAKFALGYETIQMYYDQELNIPMNEIVTENTYPCVFVSVSDSTKSNEALIPLDSNVFQDCASQSFYIATSPRYENCLRILNKGVTPKDKGSIIFYDPKGTELGRIQLEVSLSTKQWFVYYFLFGWIYMRVNNWEFLI